MRRVKLHATLLWGIIGYPSFNTLVCLSSTSPCGNSTSWLATSGFWCGHLWLAPSSVSRVRIIDKGRSDAHVRQSFDLVQGQINPPKPVSQAPPALISKRHKPLHGISLLPTEMARLRRFIHWRVWHSHRYGVLPSLWSTKPRDAICLSCCWSLSVSHDDCLITD